MPLILNFLVQFAAGTLVLAVFGLLKGFSFFRIQDTRSDKNFEKGAHLSPSQRLSVLFWRGLIATTGYMLYSWARVSIGLIDNSAIFSIDAIVYALLIWLVLGEKLSFPAWLGIAIASIGVSFIFFFDFEFSSILQAVSGGIAGLLSSFALAVIIMMNTVVVQHEPPVRIAFYQCLIGFVLSILVTGFAALVFHNTVFVSFPLRELIYSLAAGVMYATALLFFFNAFLYAEPIVIAVLGYSLTPFTAFLDWVIAGVALKATDFVSFILIAVGGGMVLLGEHRNSKTTRRIMSQPMYTLSLKERMNSIKEMFQAGELDKYDYMSQRHEFNKLLLQFSTDLQATDIESIEISKEGVVFTLNPLKIKMKCDGGCRSAPFEILNFGSYEDGEADLVFCLIKDGDVIFDVGAHLGWFSMNFAIRFRHSHIHAFEPIPRSFQFLRENQKLNGVSNLTLNNFALADSPGKKTFYYFKGGSALASTINLIEHENTEQIECSAKRLDDYCKENGISHLDFLKCDVEGGELSLLQGGIQSIKKFQPIIFIELYEEWCKKAGYTSMDVITLLRGIGYDFFGIVDRQLTPIDYLDEKSESYNYFFLHKEKHSSLIEQFSRKEI